MFKVNDDKSIYVTRGDFVLLDITAESNGEPFEFTEGGKLIFTIYEKKNAKEVVYRQEKVIEAKTTVVELYIPSEQTKLGDTISKPVDYWYEVAFENTFGASTIIGYDEEGAKIFRLFPESGEVGGENGN